MGEQYKPYSLEQASKTLQQAHRVTGKLPFYIQLIHRDHAVEEVLKVYARDAFQAQVYAMDLFGEDYLVTVLRYDEELNDSQ